MTSIVEKVKEKVRWNRQKWRRKYCTSQPRRYHVLVVSGVGRNSISLSRVSHLPANLRVESSSHPLLMPKMANLHNNEPTHTCPQLQDSIRVGCRAPRMPRRFRYGLRGWRQTRIAGGEFQICGQTAPGTAQTCEWGPFGLDGRNTRPYHPGLDTIAIRNQKGSIISIYL